MATEKVKVLEIDQFTSSDTNIEGSLLADWEVDPRTMLISLRKPDKPFFWDPDPRIFAANPDSGPSIGNVWYRADQNGRLVLWKYNYDSSD